MTGQGPVRARWADGRWHFQHGPIDLVIGVDGPQQVVAAAIEACWQAFTGVLQRLVVELPALRSAWTPELALHGPVSARMGRACAPYVHHFGLFITPMAAVAGAVADHLIVTLRGHGIERAYINNGGDIALHLTAGTSFDVGVVADAHAADLDGALHIDATRPVRGVATSGWRGRSFSLGIADSVTVLAVDAAAADAAATLIANAVDIAHRAIERAPADSLRDDTDLGARLVTVGVPALPVADVERALDNGLAFARRCHDHGLIHAALLTLQGRTRMLNPHIAEVALT
ncbi:MAG TPA: UPF0280 family protein [Burkholderiaceae bacterium]|nr:UPF0280 family protein [Burkholderiaceae bacterium]